jgi:hypothetical protein
MKISCLNETDIGQTKLFILEHDGRSIEVALIIPLLAVSYKLYI